MPLSNCKECIHTECENAGTETKVPCFSCSAAKPVEELKQFVVTHVSLDSGDHYSVGGFIKPATKKPDLVPTMNLRILQRRTGSLHYEVLQQQFLDRNVINKDGTAGGEQWIDVPIVTE